MAKGLKSAYRPHCSQLKKSITRNGANITVLMRADFACQLRLDSSVDPQPSRSRRFRAKLNTSKSITRLALKIIHFRGLTALYRPNCRRAVFICLAVWSGRVANPSGIEGKRYVSPTYLCVNPCWNDFSSRGVSHKYRQAKLTKRNELHFAPFINTSNLICE